MIILMLKKVQKRKQHDLNKGLMVVTTATSVHVEEPPLRANAAYLVPVQVAGSPPENNPDKHPFNIVLKKPSS
jgi:hypothetical protein